MVATMLLHICKIIEQDAYSPRVALIKGLCTVLSPLMPRVDCNWQGFTCLRQYYFMLAGQQDAV